MSIPTFPRGTQLTVRISVKRTSTQALVDPTDLHLRVHQPVGDPLLFPLAQLTHDGQGQYSRVLDLQQSGDYAARAWSPSGDPQQGSSPDVLFTVD